MAADGPAITSGRLLVASFLLPGTISFQVPAREKDGRFRPGTKTSPTTDTGLDSSVLSNPSSTAGLGASIHPLAIVDTSNGVVSDQTQRSTPIRRAAPGEKALQPTSILLPPPPSSPRFFRSNPNANEAITTLPKPITNKADRLKDQDRPTLTQRASYHSHLATPPASILKPRSEAKGLSPNVFPEPPPRQTLNQPRSRTGDRPSINIHKMQSSSRRPSIDSAKVFSEASWTVEKAISGNIGLHNAVNSIQSQVGKRVWIGTLGMATDTLSDRTRGDIKTELALNYSSIPVFVSDLDFEGHYHQFCKQILWPIFHYVLPDNLRSKTYEDGSWKHYVAVNRAFADSIVENYRQGDTMRKEVLQGLLGADLVGFQTYSFARHFLQTCSRILSVESSPKGIQLENTAVTVGIFPIGIDTKSLNIKRQDAEVSQWVKVLKEKYAGMKMIVARDKLDYIKGVRQKMLALEHFFNLYPEWVGKVVLIQVALSTSEQNEVQGQVSDVVTRINSKFSNLSYQPIVFLRQDITFSQYLGLLTAADLCLITSLRDGMNLTSHEYVVCQEKSKNPLVLSEFAGTYGSLSACLRVNPWNYREVAEAIHEGLVMKEEEKSMRWNELRKVVCTNTAQFWATDFVSELIKVHGDVQRRYSIHIPLLNMPVVLPEYSAAKRRLLLLDYDGTLLPYERLSAVRSKGKTSNEDMIRIVKQLTSDPRNVVYIMSGRTREGLDQIFGGIDNIGLCAEGGCFLKFAGKSSWENQVQEGTDMQWRKKVMEMFEYYKERTPGSEIEEKTVPIVWHYRQADNPSYGLWQARECQNHIEEAIGSIYPIHAVVGRKCLEVMPRDVGKAHATRTIVESLRQQPCSEAIDFVLCLGDDRSDEDMFKYCNGLSLGSEHRVVTCTVGSKSSEARWFVPGVSGVLQGLQEMADLGS
ncbi:hypothetical protein BGZ99_009115 [Dissophora globulifera]|uniref:Uncharacterized protein n=1 Tax=Dissophora globulifera TaxID=979702 RepID=A0A9P6RUW3_9FUNG|nr:hypothetical protein BGZ99_009115 [Dissophora globulifera]